MMAWSSSRPGDSVHCSSAEDERPINVYHQFLIHDPSHHLYFCIAVVMMGNMLCRVDGTLVIDRPDGCVDFQSCTLPLLLNETLT